MRNAKPMNKKKSAYKTALERPTRGAKKKGWAHADDDSMRAAYAELLGRKFCLRPEAVYDWSIKHNVALNAKSLAKLCKAPIFGHGSLVESVINDELLNEELSKR